MATRTARDLITRALRIINVLQSGETADATDAADALLTFNHMLDMWSADRLLAYYIFEVGPFPITAGLGVYTIGTTGTIVTPIPVNIEYAYTRDASGIDRTMDSVTGEAFAQITLKSVGNTFPSKYWYLPLGPNGQLSLYPLPSSSLSLFLGVWNSFTQLSTLDDPIQFVSGYESALTYSLAEMLAIEYQRPITPDLRDMANKTRSRVQAINMPDPTSVCEFEGQAAGGVSYADFIRGFT